MFTAYNLLIIEDSIPVRTAIREIIQSMFNVGRVFEASSGKEGLKILNEEIIDMILADCNIPDIDIFRFLDVLKKDQTYRFIPIVIILTERSSQRVKGLLEMCDIDYIKTPFVPEAIHHRLSTIMKKAEEEPTISYLGVHDDMR